MGVLNLALLGTPEIRHDGQVITFPTRKVMALLIYLVVEGGMHSREKITALFWPESDTARGRGSLRLTLTYLRGSLGEEGTGAIHRTPTTHLITERDSLGFNFTSLFEVDVHSLQAAFKQARTYSNVQGLPSAVRPTLLSQFQAAIDQYRGNFLDGFSLSDAPDFDDWTRLQRETLHRRMSTIFDRLSQLQFDGGEIADAIETTTCWVAHDPLNESAYYRLMQLHFAAGDRNAALHTYETCRAMLAKELSTQPALETKVLAERIRTKPLPHRVSSPTAHALSPGSTLPESPLVGRANEYLKLIEVYHTIQGGQARVGMLKGEAGIGKTRLAREFLGWAAAHGADILQGRAYETGGHLPYSALVDALRSRIEQENAPDDLLSDAWLAELSRLLPELRDRYPDLPSVTTDETTARIRLFEAVVRLGQAFAERGQVVLFIDDLQWADAASLDTLHYAGRRWKESNTPILLLLSLRSGTLISRQGLAKWLASLEYDLRATSVELVALTRDDTLQLLQALAQARSVTRDVEKFGSWLFNETHGQPFYVMEMLKALLVRGKLVSFLSKDGKWVIDFKAAAGDTATLRGMLPSNVREMIHSRLTQLTSNSFALLAAGAVLGHDFTFEQACRVAGLEENDGLVALDELLMNHQLAQSTSDEREAYFFMHDKVRDVIYTEAGETRRRVFHRRALEVLQAEGMHKGRLTAAPPADLAHHALAAGLKELAFRLSVAAGDDAMRLFAVRDAILQYEQARDLMKDVGARLIAPISTIQHLYVQLGRAYELNNEFEQARSIYATMLALARESSTPAMECVALNRLATLAVQEHADFERAKVFLHLALEVAEQSGDAIGLAETEWNLAQLAFYRFDATASLEHGEHALALARKLGLQELIARSLNVVAHADLLKGLWKKAGTCAEEAVVIFRELQNRAMEAECLCQVAFARFGNGQPRAGIPAAQEAYTISNEIENAWGQATGAMHLATGLLDTGAYGEALAFVQQAETIKRTLNVSVFPGLVFMIVGKVHRAMLALDMALTAHQEALAASKAVGLPLFIELNAAELCADCALAGKWEDAHTYAAQALDNRGTDLYLFTGLSHWYETEALVRAGDIERAEEDVRHFGERVGKSSRHSIPYLRSLAVLAQYRGEIEQAIERLQEAATVAEEIGLPGELWTIRAKLGDLFQVQGDTEQAHFAFKQAATIVRKLADAFATDEQRANFLGSPMVGHVLEADNPEGTSRMEDAP